MIEVAAHETDYVRVFAVNGAQDLDGLRQTFLSRMDDTARLPEPTYLAEMLGVAEVDPSYIELFPAKDVQELGLSSYLHQALDVEQTTLAPDRAKLDALQGYILIALSAAFQGRATRLAPGPDLTFIGTYPTAALSMPHATPLPVPESPAMPPPEDTPRTPGSASLGSGTIAVIVAVALVAAVTLTLALTGGTP